MTDDDVKLEPPFAENWSVERHDHDDGVISYEVWGYVRGEYSFLFHIYEQPFVDEAQKLADLVVNAVNAYAKRPNSSSPDGRMREALEAMGFGGTLADEEIGWRGSGGDENLFECEFCTRKHEDHTLIDHRVDCPVPRARAALSPTSEPVHNPDVWQPIATIPNDGSTVEARGVVLVHHFQGAKFAMMPKDWRPETPQTEWRLTDWRPPPPSLGEQATKSEPVHNPDSPKPEKDAALNQEGK